MIDLHMHSLYSDDGEFSPESLVSQCLAAGVSLMSICDHNCARGSKAAQAAAQARGIHFVPGIEIDCAYEGFNFHVIGYGIDFTSADFEQIEENIRRQGQAVSVQMLANTRALGFEVSEEELIALAGGSYWPEYWTGEMFAEVLLAKPGYKNHPLLAPYRPGAARGDNPYVNFYWDIYAQGKPCHVKMDFPAMGDVIRLIHQSGGLAVLAHPGNNLKGKEQLLEGILALGIDGIEAFSSYHTPEQAKYYQEAAARYQRFVTCGSDYHGKNKPAIALGDHNSLMSDEELLMQLPGQFKP